jgi:hypothetical protein
VPADKQPATGKTIGALTMTTKAARDRKIFDLWLACHTTEENRGGSQYDAPVD